MRIGVASVAVFGMLVLASCSGGNADRDGSDDATELDFAGFVPMKAGLWETKFRFDDIDVPTLGRSQKQQIMDEIADNASGRTCLSAGDAKKPTADFFGGNGAEKCVYKAFEAARRNVKMRLICSMDGMGSAEMNLSGVMGRTQFNYDSKVDVRLPMIGKVKLTGNATGKYVGACPAG
jgi:Protein of unknown function (DUF3617)